MRNHTVTLHLTKAQTTVTRTTLDRLASENLYWTTSTTVDFVIHHVLQALVVRWTKVYLCLELATRVSIIHDLETARLEAERK